MALSFQVYQPYDASPGLARGSLLYDPRGDAFPFLYSIGGSPANVGPSSHVWTLNRRTGAILDHTGQFNSWPSFGPADMDENGNLWWIGNEINNATEARQAQTKFSADSLVKIGSMTSDGSTILYPKAGQVRVDRHSSHHLVWTLDQADIHSDHGNLYAWNGNTRIRTYFLGYTTWYNQPALGVLNRVWDIDADGNGNLWCISRDDSATYTLLWKIDPTGVQTLMQNFSAQLPGDSTNFPVLKWVSSDNTLVIGFGSKLIKCSTADGSLLSAGTAPVVIQYDENYQSFHHTSDALTSVYLCKAGTTGPLFYEVSLLTLTTVRTIDFAGVAGCVSSFFNGFTQSYDTARPWRPITALYDAVLGGCWTEDFLQGGVAACGFGDMPTPPPPPPPPPSPVVAKNVGCNPLNMRLLTIDQRTLFPFS